MGLGSDLFCSASLLPFITLKEDKQVDMREPHSVVILQSCLGVFSCQMQYLQLVDDVLEVAGATFPLHDLHHLPADCPDLGALGIGSLFDLVLAALGEAHTEQAKEVAVCGPHINVGVDHGLKSVNRYQIRLTMRIVP